MTKCIGGTHNRTQETHERKALALCCELFGQYVKEFKPLIYLFTNAPPINALGWLFTHIFKCGAYSLS